MHIVHKWFLMEMSRRVIESEVQTLRASLENSSNFDGTRSLGLPWCGRRPWCRKRQWCRRHRCRRRSIDVIRLYSMLPTMIASWSVALLGHYWIMIITDKEDAAFKTQSTPSTRDCLQESTNTIYIISKKPPARQPRYTFDFWINYSF